MRDGERRKNEFPSKKRATLYHFIRRDVGKAPTNARIKSVRKISHNARLVSECKCGKRRRREKIHWKENRENFHWFSRWLQCFSCHHGGTLQNMYLCIIFLCIIRLFLHIIERAIRAACIFVLVRESRPNSPLEQIAINRESLAIQTKSVE